MRRYVVFHDYGSEGWKVFAETDSLAAAAAAREADLSNGGGRSLVFEQVALETVYRHFNCCSACCAHPPSSVGRAAPVERASDPQGAAAP